MTEVQKVVPVVLLSGGVGWWPIVVVTLGQISGWDNWHETEVAGECGWPEIRLANGHIWLVSP